MHATTVVATLAALLVAVALPAQELQPTLTELGSLGEGGSGARAMSPNGRFLLFSRRAGNEKPEMCVFDRRTRTTMPLVAGAADFTWSPRGDQVAFTMVGESGSELHVWTLAVDPRTARPAGSPRRISVRAGRGPAFSPDGQLVAFTALPASDTTAPRLVVIPATGGPERVLLRNRGFVQEIFWSPDGEWIYFHYMANPAFPAAPTLMRTHVSGGEPETLASSRWFVGLSADGRFIAFQPATDASSAQGMRIAVAATDGREVGRFTMPMGMRPGGWSSSGLRIVANRLEQRGAIRTTPITGGASRTISSAPRAASPAWSPDGRQLAGVALADERWQLQVMGASGNGVRTIRTLADPDVDPPLWSPDGRSLAFQQTRERAASLHVVGIDGRGEKLLASGEVLAEAAWRRTSKALLYVRQNGRLRELREVTLGGEDRLVRALDGELAGGAVSFVGDSVAMVSSSAGLFLLPLDQASHHRLYRPAPDEVGSRWFSRGVGVSRDGRWVALPVQVGTGAERQDALRLLPVHGGASRVVPLGVLHFSGPFQWHPDGNHLVVSGSRNVAVRADVQLVPLDGAPLRSLTAAHAGILLTAPPALSPDGSMVAYSMMTSASTSVWELDLARALSRPLLPARPAPRR